jgi:hypothetical protein
MDIVQAVSLSGLTEVKAEKRFHRIHGYREMVLLIHTLDNTIDSNPKAKYPEKT